MNNRKIAKKGKVGEDVLGERLEVRSEKDIYKHLDKEFLPPNERTNSAA